MMQIIEKNINFLYQEKEVEQNSTYNINTNCGYSYFKFVKRIGEHFII